MFDSLEKFFVIPKAIEALLWERPVFLHVSPAHRYLPEVRTFADERCFFYANDLIAPFTACVALMDADDPAALMPDRRAREELHGPLDSSSPGDHVLDALRALGEPA